MNLLREIQTSLMQEDSDIGPILLKLRFLASRLGSDYLEEWVRHESEGYPQKVDVPDYRVLSVSYTGTFSGPFGSGIQNAPIPRALVAEHCGKSWTDYEMRQSVAAIDDLLKGDDSGTLTLNASNLILLLQGKVYEDYACNSVTGILSKAALKELQYAVRSKILELTIELEKQIPHAAEVVIGTRQEVSPSDVRAVTQLTQQIFHGDYTSISSTGSHVNIGIGIKTGSQDGFIEAVSGAGISRDDATELARILAEESPESEDEPWGPKAKQWLGSNLKKAAEGGWQVGVSVATKVLTEAAMKYYGLK